jgi:hypothetical protein
MSKGKLGLLNERAAAERYAVSTRTLARWDHADLGFPKPIYMRGRRYRSVDALDVWDRDNAHRVANPRSPHRACAQALPRARARRFTKPAATR